MHRYFFTLLVLTSINPLRADWPQFRGPTGQGHADAKLPTEWDAKKNVVWRKELPGLGWSSPVIVDGKIFLTTAVPKNEGYSLRALCLDAKTGKTLWDQEVFKQDANAPRPHNKNSHASPTAVVDDGKVYVHFGHMGTACLNVKDGTEVWATQEWSYRPVHGNGGSPIIAGKHLIFNIDGSDKQLVIALDKATGKLAWKTPRENKTGAFPFSFSTPLLITVEKQDQLISAGSGVVMSLDPATGKEIWRATYGSGYSVVPRPVYANGYVYICTGYNTPLLLAIKPDGKGDVTKTHIAFTVKQNVPHNPSLLAVEDALYMTSDSGILSCLDAKSGKERWNERVGRTYSASPIIAGGLIYILDETGTTTVLKPGGEFDHVATNKLNEKSLASFGVEGNALFIRTEAALYRIEK